MNAYDHTDIVTVDSEESKVEVNFKCKELGGKEYCVSLDATVYFNVLQEEGDHLHPSFNDAELQDITIDNVIISDIEGYAINQFNTPITEDFLKDQIIEHCI